MVSEDSENVYGQRAKSVVYNDAKAEKEARSTLKSAVLRVLSKDGVVILDSLNYIKGLVVVVTVYEQVCVCLSACTLVCVVVCVCVCLSI